MEKVSFEIDAKLDKATKAVEDLTKEIENLRKEQEDLAKGQNTLGNKMKKGFATMGKGLKGLKKGISGVGMAFKLIPIAFILGMFKKLGEQLMKNQAIADTVEMVFTAIGIVMNALTENLKAMFERVGELTGGFDGLKGLMGGALTVAINSLMLVIQGLQYGFMQLKAAYESVFGSDESYARAKKNLRNLEKDMAETSKKIADGGKQIADNFVDAVGEVGQLATGVVESVAKTINEIDGEALASQAKRVVQNKKNYALMESASRRLIEQYDLEAETQRQLRDDTNASIEDRIAANEELGKVLERQAKAEKDSVNTRIAAIREQIRLEGDSHDLQTQLYDLNTELIAIDAKVAGQKSEQLTNINSLLDEQKAMTASLQESENNLALERKRFAAEQETDKLKQLELNKQILEEEKQLELERLQAIIDGEAAGTQAKVDTQIAYNERKQELNQQEIEIDTQLQTEKDRLAQEQKDREVALVEQKKAMLNQGLDAAISAAGAESDVGKGLYVAKQLLALKETIMNAKKAIMNMKMKAAESGGDLASGGAKAASSLPPPFNAIPIAIFAAQAIGIVRNIKKAMAKTKEAASQAGGGGDTGTVSAPAPVAAASSPQFNMVGASSGNQIAEALAGNNSQPVQAYVVANNVTSAQSLERNIVETTSL